MPVTTSSEALSLYADASPVVQTRVRAQWACCPYLRVAAFVPERGRVLEVGCGYGLFSCHLATSSRQRQVLGVDFDVEKVVHGRFAAQRARARGARCDVELVPPGDVPAGPWDSVVMVDVLSPLEAEAQTALLQSCAEQLALGGVLVVKDMATAPRWKARLHQLQQAVAARRAGPIPSQGRTVLGPEVLGSWMEEAGLAVSQHPLDDGYPAPHHLIVGARRRSVQGWPAAPVD